MKIPIESQQFAARLTAEDLTLVNEIIPELLPDRDLSDTTITGREILMAMAETASLKLRKSTQSQPEDLKKIEALKEELSFITGKCEKFDKELKAEKAGLAVNLQLIDELTQMVAEYKTELYELQDDNTAVKEKAAKLEVYKPVQNEMRIQLEPLTAAVLSMYAEKIRIKNKTEVQPGGILTSLFVRYITKRETELPGFPFLISKNEILTISKELAENEQ